MKAAGVHSDGRGMGFLALFGAAQDRPAEGASTAQIGVVLVDPLEMVRKGLGLVVKQDDRFDLLAEAGSVQEALERIEDLSRQTRVVVVVGLGLPGPDDGFSLIRQLRSTRPSLTVIACGANSDANDVSRALFVGADGFVDKKASPGEFLEGLATAVEGEVVVVGPAQNEMGAIAAGLERQRNARSILTERERGIVALAAEGLTARQIADRLGLRERTVTTHLGRIYAKLGVRSRLAAVTIAARQGLLAVSGRE